MNSSRRPKLADILLVEDEDADAVLVQHALGRSTLAKEVYHVSNGRSALQFLRNEAPYENAPRPDLVLLDLNMPVLNGQETLSEIRKDEALRTLPVIVMTTSGRREDVMRSYEMHANCYVRKPLDLIDFRKAVRSIESFWLGTATLPPG